MKRFFNRLGIAAAVLSVVTATALGLAGWMSFSLAPYARLTHEGSARTLDVSVGRGRVGVETTYRWNHEWPFPAGFATEFGTRRLEDDAPPRLGASDSEGGGFGFTWLHEVNGYSRWSYRNMTFPVAYPVLLLAAVPAAAWGSRRRAKRRVDLRWCARCGYDLRAMPLRCPECGEVPASAKRSPPVRAPVWRRSPRGLVLVAGVVLFAGVAAILGGRAYWRARVAPDLSLRRTGSVDEERHDVGFGVLPDADSLRRVAELPGNWRIVLYHHTPAPAAGGVFTGAVPLPNVDRFFAGEIVNADAWMKDIAGPGTGLRNLRELSFHAGDLHDAGLKYVARSGTPLGGLTLLGLYDTRVGDDAFKALASPATGLPGLRELYATRTAITDDGVRALSAPDTGIKLLSVLTLGHTRVTDRGLAALARPDSGLKHLTELSVEETGVTAAGLAELARPDSSLAELTTLELNQTPTDDAGLGALARPEGGLRSLAKVTLYRTRVSDQGLLYLAAAGGGLPALQLIDLTGTRVTHVGVQALRRARPALQLVTSSSAEPPMPQRPPRPATRGPSERSANRDR
jgi:hypothetical protein